MVGLFWFGLVWSGLVWFGLVVVFGWSVGFGFVFVLTGFFEAGMSEFSLWLAHQPSGQAIFGAQYFVWN